MLVWTRPVWFFYQGEVMIDYNGNWLYLIISLDVIESKMIGQIYNYIVIKSFEKNPHVIQITSHLHSIAHWCMSKKAVHYPNAIILLDQSDQRKSQWTICIYHKNIIEYSWLILKYIVAHVNPLHDAKMHNYKICLGFCRNVSINTPQNAMFNVI